MDTLFYIVVGLGLIAIWQVVRVYELSEELKGSEREEVTDGENRFNSVMVFLGILGFVATCAYQFMEYGKYLLPEASSKHGPQIDQLFNVTVILITVVFVICHLVLGWFAFRYFYKKDNTATYYTHNNKLEIIWTLIPTVVLIGLIGYGLTVWNNVMYAQDSQVNPSRIEVYGKQFQWLARYPGEDKQLGSFSHRLIDASNALGLNVEDEFSKDDKVVSELHLVVDKPVHLTFRSQDIIHSAYLPHFRVQMNCVPGMTTQFAFTPTKTTEQIREEMGDEKFDYVVICNKICGAAHYTMKMTVVVETQEEYDTWLGEQPVFYVEDTTSETKDPDLIVEEGPNQKENSL